MNERKRIPVEYDSEYVGFVLEDKVSTRWFMLILILICLSLLAVLKYIWHLDEQRTEKKAQIQNKAENL